MKLPAFISSRLVPQFLISGILLLHLPLPAISTPGPGFGGWDPPDTLGARVYRAACAACHGSDGTGRSRSEVAFEVALPDFSDCDFATREPDADWYAVVHQGGPTRGFSEVMPALGKALTGEQIQAALDHVRSFCSDRSWPRGELNLPRPLVTEKAYPEDEAVVTTTVAAEGPGSVMNEFLYEKRFGPRSQFEVSLPLGYRDTGAPDGWELGAGDLALGVKHTLFHRVRSGSIVSLGGEIVLPTGDDARGFGGGSTILEPFLAFGQILPAESFVHVQALGEFPVDSDLSNEAAWRLALGRSFAIQRFGRVWTPMVEILGSRELESGAATHWDLVPQLQVTLNTRQHIMANLGVRLPLDDTDVRETEVLFYVLWDWFDGGLLEGW